MKLAVLYTRLSGYVAECLKAYQLLTDAELLIFAWPPEKNAPFADNSFSNLRCILDRAQVGIDQIEAHIHKFGPDAVLVSGWSDPAYNRVCGRLKAAGVSIISGLDNQWKGSFRQHVAALVAPWHIHRFIDVLWVTGERQRQFANKLGYRGVRCWDGFYACDWGRFARPSPDLRSARPGSFLFVGRYVKEKGIRNLAAAYRIYRTEVENAWPLVCAGRGELASLLTDAGAEDRGFVQPERLPELMREASVFVLPSLFEPWGVVIQEAAVCGLPLIVSDACGAGVHLARDGYNGFVTEACNPKSLAFALIRIHRLSQTERTEFGSRSFELSKQYTPGRWAKTFREGIAMLRPSMNECMDVTRIGGHKTYTQ